MRSLFRTFIFFFFSICNAIVHNSSVKTSSEYSDCVYMRRREKERESEREMVNKEWKWNYVWIEMAMEESNTELLNRGWTLIWKWFNMIWVHDCCARPQSDPNNNTLTSIIIIIITTTRHIIVEIRFIFLCRNMPLCVCVCVMFEMLRIQNVVRFIIVFYSTTERKYRKC